MLPPLLLRPAAPPAARTSVLNGRYFPDGRDERAVFGCSCRSFSAGCPRSRPAQNDPPSPPPLHHPNQQEEARFVNSAWEEDLISIPKVGAGTKAALVEAGITNTYKLIGQFLMFRETGDNTQQRCNMMCDFLVSAGVTKALMHPICMALAKKIDRAFPGFFVDAECVQ